jgi:transposase
MEKLKVQQVQEIVHRLRQGQSERAIVRDLGYARETVRRYSRLARDQGYLCESQPLPSAAQLAEASAPLFVVRRSNVSTVEPYRVKPVKRVSPEKTSFH